LPMVIELIIGVYEISSVQQRVVVSPAAEQLLRYQRATSNEQRATRDEPSHRRNKDTVSVLSSASRTWRL
jgi:3-polyprenyl-4-hydroxybenzoate decarboxylase